MQARKPSFLNHDHALLTAMVQLKDPESCVTLVRNSAAAGAEAYGIQLCEIEQKYRTEENYRYIFSRCGNKPIYITNYRQKESSGLTDDELAEGLMLGLRAGATLIDVMGDIYAPSPLQLAKEPDAIDRQRAFIDRIHESGGEVLMSSHTWQYLTPEQILEIAKAHESRGADITKIVTCANTEEELLSNFEAMRLMKKELNIPFLFLANGAHCKLQRIVGPYFGSCMILCMYEYENHTSREQPLLRSAKMVMDHIDWDPYREWIDPEHRQSETEN